MKKFFIIPFLFICLASFGQFTAFISGASSTPPDSALSFESQGGHIDSIPFLISGLDATVDRFVIAAEKDAFPTDSTNKLASFGIADTATYDTITIAYDVDGDSVIYTGLLTYKNNQVAINQDTAYVENNDPPYLSAYSITGETYIDSTLTANYTFNDDEVDSEDSTHVNWYSQDGTMVQYAGTTHTTSSADSGYYVYAWLTTWADAGDNPSDSVMCDSVGPIARYGDTLVYYLDEDGGSDLNDGLSTVAAWATLDHADSNAVTGGHLTIIALDPRDTWTQASTLTLDASGTSNDARLIWDGSYSGWSQPNDTATILNGGVSDVLLSIIDLSYVTFQNLIIDGNDQGDYGFHIGSFSGSGQSDDVHDITIQYCDITDIGSGSAYAPAIFIRPRYNEADNIQILYNRIRHVDSYCIGLYPASQDVGYVSEGVNDVLIKGNTFGFWKEYASTAGVAIILRNETDSVTIEDNTGSDNQNGGAFISIEHNSGETSHTTNCKIRYNDISVYDAHGITLSDGEAVTADVYSNLIAIADTGSDNSVGGLYITGGDTWTSADIGFYNNTIVNSYNATGILLPSFNEAYLTVENNNIFSNDGGACLKATSVANVTHTNNLYYKEDTTYTSNYVTILSPGANYTSCDTVQSWEATAQCTDPLFNTEFTDLRPQEGSPALLKGADLSAKFTLDIIDSTYFIPYTIGAYADSVSTAVSYLSEFYSDTILVRWSNDPTPGGTYDLIFDTLFCRLDTITDDGAEVSVLRKADIQYVVAIHDSADANINTAIQGGLTGNFPVSGAVSGVTWTQYQGWQGDGTGYLTTGWNPDGDGVHFTLNSGAIAVMTNQDDAAAANYEVGTDSAWVAVQYSGPIRGGAINSAFYSNDNGADADIFLVVNRTGNYEYQDVWVDGSRVNQGSKFSHDVPHFDFYILARNNAADAGAGMSENEISYIWVGSELTDTQIANWNVVMQWFKTRMGY